MLQATTSHDQGGPGVAPKKSVPPHVEDLSKRHEPVSDFLASAQRPKTPEEWRKYELSPEQIRFFEENGYLTGVKGVLEPDQVKKLIDELKDLLDPENPAHGLFYEFHSNETGDPNSVLAHCLGHWRISPAYHDLLYHPAILVPACQLLRASVRFWHDQLFLKPPKYGGVVAWHQDYSYWTRTVPMNHLTIHIALDEQGTYNGCLHYIPKSHKWPLLPITSRHFNDMESIKKVLTEEQLAQWNPTPMLLKPGEAFSQNAQAAFHHALTVHGSYSNPSERPRRAAVVNVFADGTLSNSDEALLDGVPVIPKGQPLTGQFFPLLLDRKAVYPDA